MCYNAWTMFARVVRLVIGRLPVKDLSEMEDWGPKIARSARSTFDERSRIEAFGFK